MSSTWFDIAKSMFFGIVGAVIVLVVYDATHHPAPQIVTVDLNGLIEHKKNEYIRQNAGNEEDNGKIINKKTAQLGKAVNQIIQSTVNNNNIILIPKQAVIAGNVVDITAQIETKVNAMLNERASASNVLTADNQYKGIQ